MLFHTECHAFVIKRRSANHSLARFKGRTKVSDVDCGLSFHPWQCYLPIIGSGRPTFSGTFIEEASFPSRFCNVAEFF